MVTLYDVPAEALIDALAEELASEFEEPEWARFAKSGSGREFAPEDPGFWHRRAASVLRRLAMDGPVGVERLTTHYGTAKAGSNRHRTTPRHRSDASGKVIRTILQQLEEAGYAEPPPNGEGRVVTSAGRSLLESTAGAVLADIERPEPERYA
jgi:small subunit ribosomal protein S19e